MREIAADCKVDLLGRHEAPEEASAEAASMAVRKQAVKVLPIVVEGVKEGVQEVAQHLMPVHHDEELRAEPLVRLMGFLEPKGSSGTSSLVTSNIASWTRSAGGSRGRLSANMMWAALGYAALMMADWSLSMVVRANGFFLKSS